MRIFALIIVALQVAGFLYVMFHKDVEPSDEERKKWAEEYDRELRARGTSYANEILIDAAARAKWGNYSWSKKVLYSILTIIILGIIAFAFR